MKRRQTDEGLTELEGMALALIAESGGLTAYELKERFRGSPSSFWSGSAGAVYPLVKRLEERGLLDSRDESDTRRPRRVFGVTRSGKRALVGWIGDAERAADPGYDPLRSRLLSLEMLDADARAAFLDDVAARIAATEPPRQAPEHVARLHGLWVRFRSEWLARVRSQA